VILAGRRDVLHQFTKIPAMDLGSAFADELTYTIAKRVS